VVEIIMTQAHGSSYSVAHTILNGAFITPEAIEAEFGTVYTGNERDFLDRSLPAVAVLDILAEQNMLLFAGPQRTMTLQELIEFQPTFFESHASPLNWLNDPGEIFPIVDAVVAARWYAISMHVVEGSLYLPLSKQEALVSRPFDLPNVAEVVWAHIAYRRIRKRPLFNTSCPMRTSSRDKSGNIVGAVCMLKGDIIVKQVPCGGDISTTLGVVLCRRF
jgi:hypothetical protein